MHYRATDDDIYILTAIKPSLLRFSETASATNERWAYLQHRPLLKEDSVNQESNDEGRILLSQAAENRHDAVVKILVNDRVDMNAKDSLYGRTPSRAAENGHEAMVKLPLAPMYFIIRFICSLLLYLPSLYLLLLNLLSEFPNNLRPPCTTMPWNIRLALVVLWGVCWMFYSPTTLQPNESDVNWESELLNANSGNSFYDIYDPNQFRRPLSPLNQPWDLPQVTLEDLLQPTLGLETSASLAPPGAWSASPPDGDFEQVEANHISACQASESLEQTTMRPLPPAAGSIQNDSNGYDPTYTIQHMNSNNLLQSTMAISNRHLTQIDMLMALPTTKAAGNHMAQAVTLSQTPTNIDQSAQPSRDSEGRMICDRVECGSIQFSRRCDWKKHMDKHGRPYKCAVADCTRSNGFASKGDLERHKKTVHGQLLLHEATTRPSNSLYYCPEPSCNRSSLLLSNNAFARKDHLQEHIKRMHKDLLPKHPASMLEGSNPTAGNQYILNSNLSGLGSPAGQVHATVPSTGKRKRLEKRTLSLEDADRPQEETEELKRKVRDLERKVVSYKKTVETLLDVIRNFPKQAN